MYKFFESKFAFGAVLSLFAISFTWNASQGAALPFTGHLMMDSSGTQVAHGPSIPPDPWEGTGSTLTAHGPSIPPDPWEGTGSTLTAHGPSIPPDPWEGTGSSIA